MGEVVNWTAEVEAMRRRRVMADLDAFFERQRFRVDDRLTEMEHRIHLARERRDVEGTDGFELIDSRGFTYGGKRSERQ